MSVEHPLKGAATGFEGEVSGLGLADIIQLDAVNRFSGCIDVQYQGRRGLVFLKDGEIVHAECADVTGEAAFYEIVSWPGGRFSHQENVATTRSTIRKSCQFLILEAHRLVDERRAARPSGPSVPPPLPGALAARQAPAEAILEALRAIPGILFAVVQRKNGGRLGDDSYQGEVLAGQALYLAMIDGQLGERLQAGDAHSAVVHGTDRHVLLFTAKNHLIALLVDGGAQVGPVEIAARKVLAQGR
jgi:hypothetical protein